MHAGLASSRFTSHFECRNGEKLRKLQAHGPLYGPSLMRKARFLFSLPIFQRMNVNNQKMNLTRGELKLN